MQRSWRQRSWTLWLLLALCVAPLLSRMHQVLHVPQVLALVAAPDAAAVGPVSPEAHGRLAGAVQALFTHHGALDCQALDQLAHGQAPLHTVPWQPVHMGAAAPCLPLAAGVLSSTDRCFDARAPPQCPVAFHA